MSTTHHTNDRQASFLGFSIITVIVLFALVGCDSSGSEEAAHPTGPVITLVSNGQSVAPIILPEDALPAAREAAEDLAYHIEFISGARPEIQFGFPEEIPASAIWIGLQPGLEEVFPEVTLDFEKPEEILMIASNGHVLLAGRDRWNPDHMRRPAPKSDRFVDGVQDEYGTANAVYAFLREQLGVLWLWPGEMGIVVDPRETVAIEPFETRYVPAFRARGDAFRFSRPGYSLGNSHDWSRRQGLMLDSMPLHGGHSFTDWWDRFHKTNPEFFALQPDGTRNAIEGVRGPSDVKICQSNPAVWDQVMDDIAAKLEKEPWTTVFDISANDGAGSGICVCEDCRAWDHLDAPRRTYTWKGVEKEDVYLSNRYFTFANIIAKKLREAYPDKDYYVRDLAYHPTQTAPIGFDLEDNVVIMFVPRFPLCEDERRTAEKKDFQTWKDTKVSQFVYRPNQWISAPVGIPQVAPNKLVEEDWPFLMDIGMTGVWIDSNREHWAVYGPHIYLLGRLTWDPTADGKELLEEYYQRGFGPAADSIRAYWELMEKEFGSVPYRDNFLKISSVTFGPEVRAQAKALLDQAAQEVADAPEVFQERVAFVRAGFDYNESLYDLVKTADANKGQLAPDAFRKLLQQLDNLDETFPYAFNTHFVKRGLESRLGFKIAPDKE